MKANSLKKDIHITSHARSRLRERVVSHTGFSSWQSFVKAARYKGRCLHEMSDSEMEWCRENLHNLPGSTMIRIMNGFVFLFMGNHGHARTLVTVIPVELTET